MSPHGFWLLLDERERFLPFARFPWFADATIAELARVERPQAHHLYWPDLDVDLHLDSIDDPDAFPLVSNARPGRPPRRPTPARPRGRRG